MRRAGEEGALRLVGVLEVNGFVTGTLQVLCDGAWGAVCRAFFDDADAAVACRQLGFPSGLAGLQLRRFEEVIPDPVCLRKLRCILYQPSL